MQLKLVKILALLLVLISVPLTAAQARFSEDDLQDIQRAVRYSYAGKWMQARMTIRHLEDADVVSNYLDWLRMMHKDATLNFTEISRFVALNPDFPQIERIKEKAEARISLSLHRIEDIVAWFDKYPPKTQKAKLIYLKALLKKTNNEPTMREKDRIRDVWIETNFKADEGESFIKAFGKWLRPLDHFNRIDRLLWDERVNEAWRTHKYMPKNKHNLFRARVAMIRKKPQFKQYYAKVPKTQRDDISFIFRDIKNYNKKGKNEKARDLLLSLPEYLSHPELWWHQRETQILRALKEKEYRMAYRLASTHYQVQGVQFAEAEFLAGWLALRYVDKPYEALEHFENLYRNVKNAMSRSRAAYWVARSYEELNKSSDAERWFEKASQYKGAFFGQLSIYRLGEKYKNVFSADQEIDADIKERISQKELIKIFDMLIKVKRYGHARIFFSKALGEIDAIDELRFLFQKADALQEAERGFMRIAHLKAAQKGLIFEKDYPIIDLVKTNTIEPAFIHAIIHQESRFNAKAVSRAGARGLMQITPRTGRYIARRNNIRKHSTWKLTGSKTHNINVGSTYVKNLLERFHDSYILTLVAYNAGPSRAERWQRDYGALEKESDIDELVDWIESIPFTETRNYVQRVLEKLLVYRTTMEDHPALDDISGDREEAKNWCLFKCD
ncbi:MAG: transglycosylase SLT domain-containing protein [Alphaproteobacteria bacterium]